ncbi:MAG: hypothetical protein HKN47_22345, partial [Pirellulaceae bacterium]|nr:hypothetical protein [Pirellulaceae bacterium]
DGGDSNLFETLPEPTQEIPAPEPDSGPSLREMLENNEPQRPAPRNDTPRESDDADASSSDRDNLFQSPFGQSRDSDADRQDLERLRQRMERLRENEGRDESVDPSTDASVGAAGKKSSSSMNCEDFRQRIARETIRTLSLDISPPFRPDVFEEKEFEQIKSEFDEKQTIRDWTSLDGFVMGTGRLRDLAYEKAVIEREDGTLQQIAIERLSEGDLGYISKNWGLPNECRLEQVAYVPRNWNKSVMTWKASLLCHKPLYFEEVNLERYGHTAGPVLQPVVSSAHFFANIAVLPYKMGIHPPSECQYALGYYRPGNCAPWIVPPVPLSPRGALTQAAAMTTGFWLIP